MAAVALFLPSAWYPFVSFDDPGYIANNPFLGGFDPANLVRIWSVGGAPGEKLYIPLTYTTYFAETALFGKIPFPIHVDNILLHALNAVLVFSLARRLGLSAVYAFLASMAFVVHPLQVEPVAWCMGRKDLLSAFLALSALSVFPRHGDDGEGRAFRAAASAALGTLAMLAKPTMVVLPAVTAALWLVEGGGGLVGGGRLDSKRFFGAIRRFPRSPSGAATLFLCAAAVAVLVANLAGPFRKDPGIPLLDRALCVPVVLGGWCARFALFSPIRHFYQWPPSGMLPAAALKGTVAFAAASLLAFAALKKARFDKVAVFGLVMLAVGFLPPLAHSGLSTDFITADRYGYFPLIGAFLFLAAIAERFEGAWKKGFLALLFVWMAAGIAKSRPVLRAWSGDVAFWSFDLRSNPGDSHAQYYLALAYQCRGENSKALRYYAECLEANPKHQKALYNSGSIMFESGRYADAEALYSRAAAVDGAFKALALAGLAEARIRMRKVDSAIEALERALELDPEMGEARLRLARLFLFKGDRTRALEEARRAAGQGVDWTDDLKRAFPDEEERSGEGK